MANGRLVAAGAVAERPVGLDDLAVAVDGLRCVEQSGHADHQPARYLRVVALRRGVHEDAGAIARNAVVGALAVIGGENDCICPRPLEAVRRLRRLGRGAIAEIPAELHCIAVGVGRCTGVEGQRVAQRNAPVAAGVCDGRRIDGDAARCGRGVARVVGAVGDGEGDFIDAVLRVAYGSSRPNSRSPGFCTISWPSPIDHR